MRLVILSDIWGHRNSAWITPYIESLKTNFDVQYYDCCELGEINPELSQIEQIHQAFLAHGIETAIGNLCMKENEEIFLLGFSIGGLIAWKAALAGLKATYICAISSTRLRYESSKPEGIIDLIFAENDPSQPSDAWFETLSLERKIFKNEGHDFYRDEEMSRKLIHHILIRTKLIESKN